MSNESSKRCGYVAIVGRPNVGKSTLMNHLIQQKISITSRKPQTTRFNVTGIKTIADVQMVFVDTPGMHLQETRAINRYMNRAAQSAVAGVDVVLFLLDKLHWGDEDELVYQKIKSSVDRVIVVVNKIDMLADKKTLIPFLQMLQDKINPACIVPVSALKNQKLEVLEEAITQMLPLGQHFFPEDQVTDKSSRFLAAELIREKIMRQLGAELPYQINVEIEEFIEKGEVLTISALIIVERDGQKRILIGEKGARLKSIGKSARLDMETMFDSKVMLNLWVKVKSGWSDDERALKSLGYHDD